MGISSLDFEEKMRENLSVIAYIEHNYKAGHFMSWKERKKAVQITKMKFAIALKFCKTLKFFIFDDYCSPINATPQFLFKRFSLLLFYR